MNACLIGRHGLIGSALARKLGEFTPYPTDDTRVVYHFGSPAHPDFERAPEYHMRSAFDSFTAILPWCREHGALFVYPSSALVHEMDTQFTRHKKALEALVGCYDVRTIGLRIFPVYGPGETRTVIGQWCRAMANGERPLVYGDGNQMRDFSYSDDVATQIIAACSSGKLPQHCLMDIGSGQLTSFNAIVGIINRCLGTRLEPRYVAAPAGYSKGIAAPRWTGGVTLEEGIRLVLEGMAELNASKSCNIDSPSGRVRSGKARMAMLDPEGRRALAISGAKSRWSSKSRDVEPPATEAPES